MFNHPRTIIRIGKLKEQIANLRIKFNMLLFYSHDKIKYIFRERELILRRDGKVRYIKITSITQMVACFGAMSLLSVMVGLGALYGYAQITIAEKEQVIVEGRLAYRDLMQDMVRHQDNLNRELSAKLNQNNPQDMETIEALGHTLDAFIDRLSIDLKQDDQLANQIIRSRDRLFDEVNSLNHALKLEREARLEIAQALLPLSELIPPVNAVNQSKDRAIAYHEDPVLLARNVAYQVGTVQEIYQFQAHLAQELNQFMQDDIAMREGLLSMTNMNMEEMLKFTGSPNNIGGPSPSFETEIPTLQGEAQNLLHQQVDLNNRLDHLLMLNKLLKCLPLTAPVDYYNVSSRFGFRNDPFTQRRTRHAGLDMAGRLGLDVYASAKGVVTKAGRYSAYGNLVEIDHGCKIKTRYGHLKDIFVKVGEKIDYRHVIGTLGNTGRSTGPHVHLEVIIDGKHVDPEPFIEAGRYVFKTTPIGTPTTTKGGNPIPPTSKQFSRSE